MSEAAAEDLSRIIASARRLGVEMDEAEALQWLTAITLWHEDGEIVVDDDAGVFGHRVTMLDFSPADLAYFRRVGEIVAIPDDRDVETALALSGSAAQSKIQTYPGDCDYFQRVNIHAPSRAQAVGRLSGIMRDKARQTLRGSSFRLIEVKFGNYPMAVKRGGRTVPAGSPITWSPEEVSAGRLEADLPNGARIAVGWNDVADDPGWCKLDWVVADPVRGEVANASNMLDVTWEAPDGSIVPLDGYLDPYFQEVYLDADSIPLFSKLSAHVSPDALDTYVDQLEGEVRRYVAQDPKNYGKAAKRMYNIFRLSGRYGEAAFLRELFDEPTAVLYQVGALVRTVEEASEPDSAITEETVLTQVDTLIIDVVRTLEGTAEEEIVRQLLRLRNSIAGEARLEGRSAAVETARARLANQVNNFFFDKLTRMPEIAAYLDQVAERGG